MEEVWPPNNQHISGGGRERKETCLTRYKVLKAYSNCWVGYSKSHKHNTSAATTRKNWFKTPKYYF